MIYSEKRPPGFFDRPTEAEIKANGGFDEMLAIREKVRSYQRASIPWEEAKKDFDNLAKLAEKWSDKAYKDAHYICLASYGLFFPGLFDYGKNDGSIEQHWQNLKQTQELDKFRRGDFSAKLGREYGRSYHFGCEECCLCEFKKECFLFEDNESYGEEALCLDCLQTILKFWPKPSAKT